MKNLIEGMVLIWGKVTDYMLYLSPTFVETETEFNRLKSKMVVVGSV